uniref:Clp R domain-containing protein n=2 Tax=Chaetoceros debilis TaxID=122233 RepID=A0A7S3Q7P1_9STRA
MSFRLGVTLSLALLLLDHNHNGGNGNGVGVGVEALSSPSTFTSSSTFTMTSSSFTASRGMTPSSTFGITRSTRSSRTSSSRASSNRTGMSMVIDRLSEECIAATSVAHTLGNEFGLRLLRNEALVSGITNRPEKAGRTLAMYGLVYPLVKKSAEKKLTGGGFMMQKKVLQVPGGGSGGNMRGRDSPLPFSEDVKLTLTQANAIATHFSSNLIHSEHVLLALMGYNYGKPMDLQNVPIALTVFQMTENVSNDKFSAYDFCEDLVRDMQLPYDLVRDNPMTDDVVVIGGGSTKTNTLEEVGVDLTQMAVEGRLDKVYGRDKEIVMALRTLGRRRKNNPCLIGDPGVGKTAIAEAIAQVLASSYPSIEIETPKIQIPKLRNPFARNKNNDRDSDENAPWDNTIPEEMPYELPECPKSLAGFRIISVELASLVAGTRNRGDFEEKVQKLIKEASGTNIILFIDEIHNLIGTGGGGDGAMNAANLMKPALARGELRVMGATTTPEYRRYIEKDGALERRFQPLNVVEPTVEESIQILNTIAPQYAEYHNVEYTEKALVAAAKLSDRYMTDRYLPDKAIDLLDEAGSMIKMSDDFDEDYFVTEDAITQVISEISGIPVGRLDVGEKSRLRNLELDMGKRIKGQERAVKSVAKSIRRARSGMRDPKRPVASFLFCGPTGVGKTELCKSLAETYFGREKDMITIDMSEYMDRFATSRLVGAPPGYVGYDEGGQLTEAVRRNPHSVILFDEVEKAHEDVLNILLQIMDEGKLTDGKGRVVNFKNAVVVMTSNIGSSKIVEASKANNDGTGLATDIVTQSLETARLVKEELEESWKPELLNRIDEIVIFSPLSFDNLRDIAANLIDDTAARAAEAQNVDLTVADNLIGIVAREGALFSGQYGARPIKRAVQRYLEDTMSEAIMRDFVKEGDEIQIEMSDVTEIRGTKLEEGQAVVQITKYSAGGNDSILIPVEAEGGIGGAVDNDWQALYGDLPSLDDGSDGSPPSPPRENDATWG